MWKWRVTMYIKIHRGSRQIGGNIIEVGTENNKIILDCGRNLPALDGCEAEDKIDIDGLTSGVPQYGAVFISHYHADHCGHINRILPEIPVYMGEATKDVLTIIADFTNTDIRERINTFSDSGTISQDDISVTPIQVKHSAADAYMFLVRADGKVVLYTGDYKQDDLIVPKIRALLGNNEKIDILLTEGTNVAPARSVNTISTEEELTAKCVEIMESTAGDVFVLGSSTNIDRINAVMDACEQSGRTFAEDLFTACIMDAVGCVSAFSDRKIKGFVWHGFDEKEHPRRYRYFKEHYDRRELRGIESTSRIKNLCAYIRPTMLTFLEELNKHRRLSGSTLIYSFWSGYRQKENVVELLDFCQKAGMNIVPLHVSGHATNEEIAGIIRELEPRNVVPIHCESRELFADIANNCVFLEDNEAMEV
jgi:ribonuclease J